MKKNKKPIHPVIKKTLGYPPETSDADFLKDWKHKSTIVCKPCWELKYCPYGPFVEQSPLLPCTREHMIEHIEYLKKILETKQIGEVIYLNDEIKQKLERYIEICKKKPFLLIEKVASGLLMKDIEKRAEDENKDILEFMKPPLSEFEKYKVPFSLDDKKVNYDDIEEEITEAIEKEIKRLENVVKTGIDDRRKPLDKKREQLFKAEVINFNPNEYPDEIPKFIKLSECNLFGHICPVVFVGESITETTEKRLRSRKIPNKTRMRVVRRDNYTCQKCGKHLMDNELEFDHIIPYSKGGSSDENNIRLTCFSCNREKKDKIEL